ncbi:MAG TPA: CHAD domain-containing protein, partial [Gemmatimonadales bacterium]|nr:CHAD domain-containing protein [Gemmatimonadales bacterium]
MRLPDSLLELPAEEGARLIALGLIQALWSARLRLGTGDPEALHDFRVALRRLRTALRTYRPQVRESAPRRSLRRLRRLARATRDSRDLEVHIAWSRAQAPRLTPRQQVGVEWLLDRMERRRRESDAALGRRVARDFERTIAPLERRLSSYHATIGTEPLRRSLAVAAVVGAAIGRLAGDLEAALGHVHGVRDEEPAHRARIAAKRLRYALEPIAGLVAGVGPLIERLRTLQDELGDLHDSHVFVAELARAVE